MASGSMFIANRLVVPGIRVGEAPSGISSISSRLDAGSVLTSRTLPRSDKLMATAQASEVLPTPPLPVKNRWRVGWPSRPDNKTERRMVDIDTPPTRMKFDLALRAATPPLPGGSRRAV